MSNKKILIVQSSPSNSQTIANTFEEIGYEVRYSSVDGGSVVTAIQMCPPDVAIIEANMPNGDALSVINSAINKGTQAKFIVTSTSQNNFIQEEINQKEGCYFLQTANATEIVEKTKTVIDKNDVAFNSRNIKKVVNFTRQNNLEEVISSVLHNIGIPAHVKGYRYIRHSIMLSIEDSEMINSVTKLLYPAVAKQFQTTPSRVERAIRHAIELAWNRGDFDTLTSYFGYTIDTARGKPTNSEFIAMLSDKLRMKFY